MAKLGEVYEPLAEVRKELKVKWIRLNIDQEKLRELNKRNDMQGWIQSLGHLGIWMVTGAFVYYFWAHEIWLAFLIALFLHGTVASFLWALRHMNWGMQPSLRPRVSTRYSCISTVVWVGGINSTMPPATPIIIVTHFTRKEIAKTCYPSPLWLDHSF